MARRTMTGRLLQQGTSIMRTVTSRIAAVAKMAANFSM
jgi:hypothetical protein